MLPCMIDDVGSEHIWTDPCMENFGGFLDNYIKINHPRMKDESDRPAMLRSCERQNVVVVVGFNGLIVS